MKSLPTDGDIRCSPLRLLVQVARFGEADT
jgi:hypothetical protein